MLDWAFIGRLFDAALITACGIGGVLMVTTVLVFTIAGVSSTTRSRN